MTSLLVAALCGLALMTGAYALMSLFRDANDQQLEYRDKPPAVFRFCWPLVQLMAQSCSWMLSAERRSRLHARLRRAGQEYALTPEQFWGGKLTAAGVAMVVGWVLGGAIGLGGPGAVLLAGLFGFVYPDLWLNDRTKQRNLQILKALPFFLDIVTLSVEAGLNLSSALQQSVDKSKPGPLIHEMNRVLRDVRGGRPRVDALRELAERLDFAPVSSLVSALVQGELMGSSLGPILRAQSDQRRVERFQRAEKLAMEAPVKMLGPLIMFIFPCTFIVLGFPIVMKFLQSGL